MKVFASICLTFVFASFLICYGSSPASVIGFHSKTELAKNHINNAAPLALATGVYAIDADFILSPTDAATGKEVAILTKTPTVEVKAKTTVTASADSYRYQRICKSKFTFNHNRNSGVNLINLHINPGLRGC